MRRLLMTARSQAAWNGLTVSQALWKRKPVIGGAVGGIKLQIINGVTGFPVHSPEGAVRRLSQLMADPQLCAHLGESGYRHVQQNFLLTRHVKDYMLVMLTLDHPDEDAENSNLGAGRLELGRRLLVGCLGGLLLDAGIAQSPDRSDTEDPVRQGDPQREDVPR